MDNHIDVVEELCERGAELDTQDHSGFSAVTISAIRGHKDCVKLLLNRGSSLTSIQNSLNSINDEIQEVISEEVIFRSNKERLEVFINASIEFNPHKNHIYSLCYPPSHKKRAIPLIGFEKTIAILENYYFDEIFLNLHLHIATVYKDKEVIDNDNKKSDTTTSYYDCKVCCELQEIINKKDIEIAELKKVIASLMPKKPSFASRCTKYLSRNSDKTSTLMTVLTDRLKMYLKPNILG